jgi:hypothetical protein
LIMNTIIKQSRNLYNLDMFWGTHEIKINFILIIDRQRQNVESTQILVDSTICLGSETDHQFQSEEAKSLNTFGRFYKFLIYSLLIPFRKTIVYDTQRK